MKITQIETIVVNTPILIAGKIAPKASGLPRTSINTLMVRVDTDEGLTGWGEGFGHRIYAATKAVIDDILTPLCIGRDPTQITTLVDELQRSVAGSGRNGPAMYAFVGYRHCAVGYRGQGGGPAAVSAARWFTAQGAARVCQPVALRRCKRNCDVHRARIKARL